MPLDYSCGDDEEPPLLIWVATHCCYDWSDMGSKGGWTGTGTIPLLTYPYHAKKIRPHIIVSECTSGFDITVWKRVLGNGYTVLSRKMNSADQGIPMLRPRLYTISISDETLNNEEPFDDSAKFDVLFGRSLQLTGEVFLQATAQERRREVERLGGQRPHAIEDMSEVLLRTALKPGTAIRLEGYAAIAKLSDIKSKLPTLIASIAQEPTERMSVNSLVPTLLRESILVLIKSDALNIGEGSEQLMLGGEHLAAMGWPIYQVNLRCAIRDALPSLSEPAKRTLTGDGLCIPQIGCVILFALASNARV